jgi:hypothetical protein
MEALPKPAELAGLIPPPEKMTPLPQQAAQTDTADAVTSQPIQGSARFGAVGGTGKEIVGEGEKEFEENETAFGKKTAENVQAAGKIGDAASDVYGDKIDELNKEAFKTAVEQFHRNNPHADSGPQTSSAVVEKQILAADSVDIDMHGTDHVGAAVIGAVGTYQIIKNKYGDGITEGWQDLKDNVKVSSPEALDKLAEETKSSLESDQNKLLQQIEFNDKQGIRPAEPQPEQPDAQASKFANPKGPEESKFVHPDTVETTRPHPNLGELVTQPPDGARSAPATSMEYEGSATFGKVGGLSGQDAELVRLFAERQNDLGKAGQGVQDYAGQLKTMEAQAPAPTAPAPSLEVQTVPAAPQPSPAPAPTPAPQQPAPSISPSL